MAGENAPDKPGDPIETVLDEFREAYFRGTVLDLDRFCNDHPECGPKLREEIESFLMVAGGFPALDPEKDEIEPEEAGEGESKKPDIMGDFRILREIGRGGMGIVYEAEQISLKRKVALKILPLDLGFCDDAVLKFRREAEAGGRQSHTGVVAVYSTGAQGGRYYIAQELVEGGYTLADRLDDWRKEKEFPKGHFRNTAALVAKVADALEHAHRSGVIHRDIKPSNILLTSEGQPKITDFGLAKLEDAVALSRTGDFAGTPFYMSPEQVTGRGKGADRRTDIYSLGVTLYELLTLKQPFEGKSSYEVLKKIPVVDPIDPCKVNPRVPRDLSTICLKAIEKSPEKRYRTMKELEDDLTRFLSGEVILARPAGLDTRIWKKVKRNPVMSAAVGVAALAIIAFLGYVLLWSYPQIKLEKDRALEAQQAAEEEKNRFSRLSDLNLVYRLKVEAEELWPAYPWKIEELENWLAEARGLLARNERYRSEFDRLHLAGPLNAADHVLKDNLEKLVWEIDSLGNEACGLIMNVAGRLGFAKTVHERSIVDYKSEWNEAIASIANELECPKYKGLVIEPILGLVPIGCDRESGLWEFAHLQTGVIPERDDEGKLILNEEMGMVFVLLPGGTFDMGAIKPDEKHTVGMPNVDPNCDPISESPVRSVDLDPFFISKFEMTQGQWLRFTGNNPSQYDPGWTSLGSENVVFTLRHPVEMVNWRDCYTVLGRLNLVMPTDAQWEYAFRSGTSTVWYTGNDPDSLEGHENIADEAYQGELGFREKDRPLVSWNDNHAYTAPVGSYSANGFGLHDMGGNLTEWCGDRWKNMRFRSLSHGDGSRMGLALNPRFNTVNRCLRGGHHRSPTESTRATYRSGSRPNYSDQKTGVRPAMKLPSSFTSSFPSLPRSHTTWYVPDDFPAGINAALRDDAVSDGDTIVVRPGTYQENIDFIGKAVTVKSERGPKVTVLDGKQSGSVVVFQMGETFRTKLEGFTITNGTGHPTGERTCGGGILCDNGSSPTIANNIITKNTAYFGGGIYPSIDSSPKIEHNLIIANSAECGGGLMCFESASEIRVNVICDNTAVQGGGGILSVSSCLKIINNTIIGNNAVNVGGGICCINNDEARVVNTIVWNNHAETGQEIYLCSSSHNSPRPPCRFHISFSDVKGGRDAIHIEPWSTLNWGPGMMDADPLFVDPVNNDFRLSTESPCKDTGENASVTDSTDFEGDPRIKDGTVDLGADER